MQPMPVRQRLVQNKCFFFLFCNQTGVLIYDCIALICSTSDYKAFPLSVQQHMANSRFYIFSQINAYIIVIKFFCRKKTWFILTCLQGQGCCYYLRCGWRFYPRPSYRCCGWYLTFLGDLSSLSFVAENLELSFPPAWPKNTYMYSNTHTDIYTVHIRLLFLRLQRKLCKYLVSKSNFRIIHNSGGNNCCRNRVFSIDCYKKYFNKKLKQLSL